MKQNQSAKVIGTVHGKEKLKSVSNNSNINQSFFLLLCIKIQNHESVSLHFRMYFFYYYYK